MHRLCGLLPTSDTFRICDTIIIIIVVVIIVIIGCTQWHSWLRHYSTSRKVAVSIPDDVIDILLT